MLRVWVAAMVSAAFGALVLLAAHSLGARVGVALLVGLMPTLVYPRLIRRRVLRMFAGMPGEHYSTLSADDVRGVTAVSESWRSWRSWAGIVRVANDTSHLYPFVERRMAFVIPLGAFSSSAESARFSDAVHRLRAEHDPSRT
jgi:hypothetical protein